VHPDDLSGGFSDLEMTWPGYFTALAPPLLKLPGTISHYGNF